MKRPAAVLGSAIFFIVVPCVVAGVVPWLITNGYHAPVTSSSAMILLGGALIAAGLPFLIHSFARFAIDGLGTPAPVAPTAKLVVSGVYRHVRNPMYLAVLSIILGQAMLFASASILIYGAVAGAAMVLFVMIYEEPTLQQTFGAQYDAYRQNVPGWLPRLTPWTGD